MFLLARVEGVCLIVALLDGHQHAVAAGVCGVLIQPHLDRRLGALAHKESRVDDPLAVVAAAVALALALR